MAQDKFNAKADATGLSMLLKKKSVHGKTVPPTLQGNWPEAADIRLRLLKGSSGPLVDFQMTRIPEKLKNWLLGKVFNISEDFKVFIETQMWYLGIESMAD